MGIPDVFADSFRAETLRLGYLLPAQVPMIAACAISQAFFESDGFHSPVFLATNNCIGYKYVPGSRWQSGHSPHKSTEGDYYALYADVGKCAGELANWLYRRGRLFKDLAGLRDYVHRMKLTDYYGVSEEQYLRGCDRYFTEAARLVA